ncbi:phage tail tube protein [Paracidovorax citrulli]|uniref:phage tail tube protein n=1 Tax=Paracidovorax citrulli TaxID=80869 RepID=UPI00087E44B6|nr:phage tail tube protein [Paracidovorax citrulli]UMT88377.1 phage tail protein [Paracidovorax citrulli]WIY32714.1 phage tail tube protein [Paracidovorax citrulli]SDJ30918.1 Phage tail tube protein, TTP [Paracidovorax citrulli]
MARTPTGTIHSVATVLATAKTISNITNAAEAVVSSAGHGYSNGDIVLVFSGWGRLNFRAFRVKGVSTDSFVLEGANTTNTELFTPGSGGGSVQKVTTWVDLDKTLNHSTSGGDAKTVNVKFIESDVEVALNDGFNAVQRTFDMDADMIGTPAYAALKLLSETNANTVVRRRTKSGAISLIPATVSFNEEETLTEGQIVTVKGTFNAQNVSTRYAA